MQKLLRDGKWVKRERAVRRTIDFRLDESDLGKIVDLPKDPPKDPPKAALEAA